MPVTSWLRDLGRLRLGGGLELSVWGGAGYGGKCEITGFRKIGGYRESVTYTRYVHGTVTDARMVVGVLGGRTHSVHWDIASSLL